MESRKLGNCNHSVKDCTMVAVAHQQRRRVHHCDTCGGAPPSDRHFGTTRGHALHSDRHAQGHTEEIKLCVSV